MTLYVCMGGDYEGDWITAIFDTREAAEAHIADRVAEPSESRPTRIEEYELNAQDPVKPEPPRTTGRGFLIPDWLTHEALRNLGMKP